jgi:hypothetical protein
MTVQHRAYTSPIWCAPGRIRNYPDTRIAAFWGRLFVWAESLFRVEITHFSNGSNVSAFFDNRRIKQSRKDSESCQGRLEGPSPNRTVAA